MGQAKLDAALDAAPLPVHCMNTALDLAVPTDTHGDLARAGTDEMPPKLDFSRTTNSWA
jgi:hypothetical protein